MSNFANSSLHGENLIIIVYWPGCKRIKGYFKRPFMQNTQKYINNVPKYINNVQKYIKNVQKKPNYGELTNFSSIVCL